MVANSDFAGVIIEHSLYSLTDNVNNNHTLNEHNERTFIYERNVKRLNIQEESIKQHIELACDTCCLLKEQRIRETNRHTFFKKTKK